MTAQEARTHIRYSGWASRKVLEAALALSPEDRAKPMNVSHESVAKTLTHIYFGDAICIRASPTATIPCHLTMRSPRSISLWKNGLASVTPAFPLGRSCCTW